MLEALLRRLGYVKLDRYGLILTPEGRIATVDGREIDGGFDDGVKALPSAPAAQAPAARAAQSVAPSVSTPAVIVDVEAPREVATAPATRAIEPTSPEPLAADALAAAFTAMNAASQAAMVAAVPAAPPEPVVGGHDEADEEMDEEEWEWQLALARARAVAEDNTAAAQQAAETPAPAPVPRRAPVAAAPAAAARTPTPARAPDSSASRTVQPVVRPSIFDHTPRAVASPPARRATTAPVGPPPRTVIPVPALPVAKASAVQPIEPRPAVRPAVRQSPAPQSAAVRRVAARPVPAIPADPVGEQETQFRRVARSAPSQAGAAPKKPAGGEPDDSGSTARPALRADVMPRAAAAVALPGVAAVQSRASALGSLSARIARADRSR